MKKNLKAIGTFVYQSLNKPGRRIVSLLLACAMLLAQFPSVTADASETSGSSTVINVQNYSGGSAYIYSWTAYQTPASGVGTAGGTYQITGERTDAFNVYIGDYNETYKINHKIDVALNELILTNADSTIYINTVNDGSNVVDMTVESASQVTNLVVLPNAKLTLTVQAQFDVTNLYLGQGSHLTLSVADGVACNIANLDGTKGDGSSVMTSGYETYEPIIVYDPPLEEPPVLEPPVNEPPADEPPADEPPADEPPADEPPVVEVPVDPVQPSEPEMATLPGVVSVSAPSMSGILTLDRDGFIRNVPVLTSGSEPADLYGDVSILSGSGQLNLTTARIRSLSANAANIYVETLLDCDGAISLAAHTTLTGTTSTSVTADGDISVSASTVQTFALFGYDAFATGAKTMHFDGAAVIKEITRLGAADGTNAIVTIEGLATDTNPTNFTAVSDFPVQFYTGENAISMNMTHYRAQYDNKDGSSAAVVGAHRTTDEDSRYSTELTLPEYAPDGYTYQGWKLDESETVYTTLPQTVATAQTLTFTAYHLPKAVTLNWNYNRAEDAKTEGDWPSDSSVNVDETISLGEADPYWLGKTFQGWAYPKRDGSPGTIAPGTREFEVSYEDVAEDSVTGELSLNLTAQWENKTYIIHLSTRHGSEKVTSDNMEVSFDGGANWHKLSALSDENNTIVGYSAYFNDGSAEYIRFPAPIHYGETLGDFLERADDVHGYDLQLPLLRDANKDEGHIPYDFFGWQTINTVAALAGNDRTFDYGKETSLLQPPSEGESLAGYDSYLQSHYLQLSPVWGTMSYRLQIDTNALADWSFLINGEEAIPDASGLLLVPNGARVTLQTAYTNTDLATNWRLTAGGQPIYLTEGEFDPSDTTLDYTFTMPAADVAADYAGESGEPHYFDLSKAAITFEESVLFNGLSRDGFWYNWRDEVYTPLFAKVGEEYKSMAELTAADAVETYFYAWPKAAAFYVTSHNVATPNQLTLVNAMTVYLKNCNLETTQAYKDNFDGYKLAGKVLERLTIVDSTYREMGTYANIVIDQRQHDNYPVTLQFQGENTVGCVAQDVFRVGEINLSSVTLRGSNRSSETLHLGTVIGNFELTVINLNLKEIENDSSSYLLYTFNNIEARGQIRLSSCYLDAPSKRVYSYRYGATFTSVEGKVGGTYGYGVTTFNGNSNIHILGDAITNHGSIQVAGTAKVVVEGSVNSVSIHWSTSATVNTTGYLIVKGEVFYAGGLTLQQGTVIANAITTSNKLNITGGTLITNIISNRAGNASNSSGDYSYVSYRSTSGFVPAAGVANGDYDVFYHSTNGTADTYTYQIENAEVYLLGYYNVNENKRLDTSVTAMTEGNPLKAIIEEFETTGSVSELPQKVAAQAAVYGETMPECVVFGSTIYNENTNTSGIVRNVSIGGNVQLYAAGNLTFFNDTTISDGSVLAHGELRSKRDLTITGGQVTAAAVGNRNNTPDPDKTWDLKYKFSDGTYRWQATTISGGTVYTDMLGSPDPNNVTTLVLSGGSILPREGTGTVSVYQDVLTTKFQESTTQENIKFQGTLAEGQFSGMSTTPQTFSGSWRLGSLSGNAVTSINAQGVFDDTAATKGYEQSQLLLYQVQNSYSFTVKAAEYSATLGETALSADYFALLNAGQTYTITLTDEAEGKAVLLYRDALGALHNVVASDFLGTTMTFTMPYADVELWITDEFSLDLYSYPIALTETGFETSPELPRADSAFRYTGNIRIWQSVTNGTYNSAKTTANKIYLQGVQTGRAVTLDNVNQFTSNAYGTIISNVTMAVNLKVRGTVNLSAIQVPELVSLTIEGETGHTDHLRIKSLGGAGDIGYYAISNKGGILGSVTLKNFSLYVPTTGSDGNPVGNGLFYSSNRSSNLVLLENVKCENHWLTYAYRGVSANVSHVKLVNTDIEFRASSTWPTWLFTNCAKLEIVNSHISYQNIGGTYGAYPLLYGYNTELVMDNSTLTMSHRNVGSSTGYKENIVLHTYQMKVTMNNGSKILATDRLQVRALVVDGGSSVTVSAQNGPAGYLLCNDIDLKDGSIEADHIIVSAFTKASSAGYDTDYSNFLTWAGQSSNANRVETGTLTQTGGSIIAKQIGGAYGATLNIQGGELTADAVGTLDAIYGYASVIPPENEVPVYRYELDPNKTNSKINISDGRVTIEAGGYLGGHNSTIQISGGEVVLGENAVLGMTDSQLDAALIDAGHLPGAPKPATVIKTTVEISGGTVSGPMGNTPKVEEGEAVIRTPYQSVTISGADTRVRVGKILAPEGTISITDAAGEYLLPEGDFTEHSSEKMGVYVGDRMEAMRLEFAGTARVYSGIALANIPEGAVRAETGVFMPDIEGESTARLFAGDFGITGPGADETCLHGVKTSGGAEAGQNVFERQRVVRVSYHLNGDEADPAYNHPDNPAHFIQNPSATETLTLYAPTRFGFLFEGWYLDTGFVNRIEKISTAGNTPIELYAKWKAETVTIQVVIDTTKTNVTAEPSVWASELDEIATPDGDTSVYTFKKAFTVDYRGAITGEGGIDLNELHLKSYSVDELAVDLPNYNPILGTSAPLDKTLLEQYHAYLQGADNTGKPLRLRVTGLDKGRELITFDLTRVARGASFTTSATGTTVTSYVEYGKAFSTGEGLTDADGNFIAATAPGYVFQGWRKGESGTVYTPDQLANMELATGETQTTYYAVWEAKTYRVEFKADGGSIDGGVLDENKVVTISYNGTFGKLPTIHKSGQVFQGWTCGSKKIENTMQLNLIQFTAEELDESAGNTEQIALTITPSFESVEIIYDLQGGEWVSADMQNSERPLAGAALRGYSTNVPAAGNNEYTIAGGTYQEAGETTDYGIVLTTADYFAANNKRYYATDDPAANIKDYRYTLQRKGYTFEGWYTAKNESGHEVHTTPENPNEVTITLYAHWSANTYHLELHAYDVAAYQDSSNSMYQYTDAQSKFVNDYLDEDGTPVDSNNPVPMATLTVGGDIPDPDDDDNQDLETHWTVQWPKRTETNGWYVYSTVDQTGTEVMQSDRRYLLGFTFAPLDPGCRKNGTQTYSAYARDVTDLFNEGLLLQPGSSTFTLPQAFPYVEDFQVEDYPDGSTMPLYAVYRERSLVFIQAHTEGGVLHQKELHAVPYQTWSDYPWNGYQKDTSLTGRGYSQLENWYFLSPTPANDRIYADDGGQEYEQGTKNYVYWANRSGNPYAGDDFTSSYDIRVYTVYVARDSYKASLVADRNYARTNDHDFFCEYTIPSSMASDAMTYQIESLGGLTLVPRDTILNDRHNPAHATATAAIRWELQKPNGQIVESGDLQNDTGSHNMGTAHVGAGYKIILRLYTSKLLADDGEYHLKIKFGFQNDTLKNQYIELTDLTVDLNPTDYAIRYDANLPNDNALEVTEYTLGYVKEGSGDHKWNTTIHYNDPLTSIVPRVVGYTVAGTEKDAAGNVIGTWHKTDEAGALDSGNVAIKFGDPLSIDLSTSGGKLYFKTEWQAKTYPLTVSADVMKHWNVKVETLNFQTGDGDDYNAATVYNGTDAINETIPYHAKVTFTQKPGDDDKPHFVNIVQKDGANETTATLDRVENKVLTVQDGRIDVTYSTVRTLYLEDGDITIHNDNGTVKYDHKSETLEWPGSFVILMDENNNSDKSKTTNVLTLQGDLKDVSIHLGDLNITEDDSIQVTGTAKLTLEYNNTESTIHAKNILVGNGAQLTMEKGSLALAPEIDKVALGGDDAAEVTLTDVGVSMTLPGATYGADSTASGIGAKTVNISDGTITVKQEQTPGYNSYSGAWIGGENTNSVTLDNTKVLQHTDSEGHNQAYAIYADDVELNSSSVGQEPAAQKGVSTRVYAANNVTLNNSSIYQVSRGMNGLPLSADGEIQVTNSQIHIIEEQDWQESELNYEGTMKIMDSDSDVVIDGTRILELANGNVEITDTGVKQAGETESHTGSYLLLEERLISGTDPKLTVTGIDNGTILVKQADDTSIGAFRLTELNVAVDTTVKLATNTQMTVNKVVYTKDAVTLTVDAARNGTVNMEADAVKATKGTYVQNGGTLTGGTIQGDALDVQLNGVTVTATDLIAKNLTLTGSNVTCTGRVGSMGEGEVTTVSILGTTRVNAATVGALGAENTTFTFVEVDDDTAAINGTLVQDHYRIAYEQKAGVTNPDYTVFRTKQTGLTGEQTPTQGGVPDAPDPKGDFAVWYYKDGEQVYAVSENAVAGYAGHSELNAELLAYAGSEDDDGTQTLMLYAGMNLQLSATIGAGRMFKAIEGAATEVTIPANSAWTACFTVTGTVLPGSAYQVVFGEALPAGTKLTLTVLDETGKAKYYYYYNVIGNDVMQLTLGEFTKMGDYPDVPDLTRTGTLVTEKLLLAADFSKASAAAGTNTVSFRYMVDDNSVKSLEDALSYTRETVNDGSVTATQNTVTVTAPSVSLHENKPLALVAEINADTVSPKAVIKLGDAVGQPIGNGQYVFQKVEAKEYAYDLTGFYGDSESGSVSITWKLMLERQNGNVLADELAKTSVELTAAKPAEPSLTVRVASPTSRTLVKGNGSNGHTVQLVYETNASAVEVTLEQQSGTTYAFTKLSNANITVETGTITVVIPDDVGTYRICVSMDDNSSNDNVYHTFVVVAEASDTQ